MKYLAVWLLMLLPALTSADVRFLATASDKAIMLARGATFAGIEDEYYTLEGNPAALDNATGDKLKDWRLYFNPVLPSVLLYDTGVFGNEPRYTVNRKELTSFLAVLLSAFRGLSYESHPLFIKLRVLEEQQLARLRFPVDGLTGMGIFENNSNTLLCRLQLANSVSLGVTGSFYRLEDVDGRQRQGGGISYGILLKPSRRLSIGLVYFNLPDQFSALREPLERLGDETVNAGFVYRATDHVRLVLDVRNLTNDQTIAPREFHMGAEAAWGKYANLDAGCYFPRGGPGAVLSLGAGLARTLAARLPWGGVIGACDYSLVYETRYSRTWHALTFNYAL